MQTFDVRPILAQGGHPLDAVNAAWAALPAGQRLCVIAPFEPAPMMAMFSAQGVAVACREAAPGEFHLLLGPK
jgi:uncharacterized protein (DUF2249 family)